MFNNKKPCPYDDRCAFLHEDSKFCRYGVLFEQVFCKYNHEKQQVIFENIDSHLDHTDVIDVSEAETDQGDFDEEMNLNDSVP